MRCAALQRYFRPEELHDLKGDATKLRTELGWESDYTFESLMDDMLNEERRVSGVGYDRTPYDAVM